MINRVNEDYYHYLMYVVYGFDKRDKIILDHHYQRYFHLDKKKINKNRNTKYNNEDKTKISIEKFLTIIDYLLSSYTITVVTDSSTKKTKNEIKLKLLNVLCPFSLCPSSA